jgi:hypothetical protein
MAARSRGRMRPIAFLACLLGWFAAFATPAAAQGLLLLRDTETERAMRSYEDPLLKAGGLDPAGAKLYLVNDPSSPRDRTCSSRPG